MEKVVGWSISLPNLVVVTSLKLHLGMEKDPPEARWASLASWVMCWSLWMLIVGGLVVMLEPDEMERSSAKHDPLLCLISLVTGFRIIHALTKEFSRARFVMSWDASQFGAEMPPPSVRRLPVLSASDGFLRAEQGNLGRGSKKKHV